MSKDDLDIDVTVIEDWEDDTNVTPRQRTTTVLQSPIELSVLLELCRSEK